MAGQRLAELKTLEMRNLYGYYLKKKNSFCIWPQIEVAKLHLLLGNQQVSSCSDKQKFSIPVGTLCRKEHTTPREG